MNHVGSGSRAWNEISVDVDTRAVVDLEVNGNSLSESETVTVQ